MGKAGWEDALHPRDPAGKFAPTGTPAVELPASVEGLPRPKRAPFMGASTWDGLLDEASRLSQVDPQRALSGISKLDSAESAKTIAHLVRGRFQYLHPTVVSQLVKQAGSAHRAALLTETQKALNGGTDRVRNAGSVLRSGLFKSVVSHENRQALVENLDAAGRSGGDVETYKSEVYDRYLWAFDDRAAIETGELPRRLTQWWVGSTSGSSSQMLQNGVKTAFGSTKALRFYEVKPELGSVTDTVSHEEFQHFSPEVRQAVVKEVEQMHGRTQIALEEEAKRAVAGQSQMLAPDVVNLEKKTVRLYRGGGAETPLASWTPHKDQAESWAQHHKIPVSERDVPFEDVFMFENAPDWYAPKGQHEFTLISR